MYVQEITIGYIATGKHCQSMSKKERIIALGKI